MNKKNSITTEKIKALKPCDDRFNNFTKYYPGFKGSLTDFLSLDNITYSDKIWVFTRLATHIENVRWSILCADSVLQNFELFCPNDDRPRKALEAAEAFAFNPTQENKDKAYNAATSAYNATYSTLAAAYSAADAAIAAAADAAYSAAATYSAATDAAYSAAYDAALAADAAYSAAAEKQQEELNLMFMLEAIRSN